MTSEVIAARTFQSLYIWLDLAFLVAFVVLLVWQRKYQALILGAIGGVIYFVADYGIFLQLLGTRTITGASPFWVLLWLSLSYGLTNFAWIWLLLDRDKHVLEWSLFIVAGWLCVALLSQQFGYDAVPITTRRGTGQYHGVMALILFLGYAGLIVYNLRLGRARGGSGGPEAGRGDDGTRAGGREPAPILRILVIGILIQLSWEAVLAISGIRTFSWNTLIVNSLVETNMGLPYLWLIHRAMSRRWDEGMRSRIRPTATESLHRTAPPVTCRSSSDTATPPGARTRPRSRPTR